jgi:hypothetical protein
LVIGAYKHFSESRAKNTENTGNQPCVGLMLSIPKSPPLIFEYSIKDPLGLNRFHRVAGLTLNTITLLNYLQDIILYFLGI